MRNIRTINCCSFVSKKKTAIVQQEVSNHKAVLSFKIVMFHTTYFITSNSILIVALICFRLMKIL